MPLIYGKHKVRDYDHWRPYFDNDQDRFHSVGAKTISVMRSTTDPNEVHFVFEAADLARFVGEMENPEVAKIMQDAGVLEKPTMYILQEPGH